MITATHTKIARAMFHVVIQCRFTKIMIFVGLLFFTHPSYSSENNLSDHSLANRNSNDSAESEVTANDDVMKNLFHFQKASTDRFGSDFLASPPEIMLDLGQLITEQSGVLEVGASYEEDWHNKVGNNHEAATGVFTRTPMVIARMHF